jgi:hypothetical protein
MTAPLTGRLRSSPVVAAVSGAASRCGWRDGADIALVDIGPDGINAVADEIAEIGSKATAFVRT